MDLNFVNIELSQEQATFLAWAQKHYQHLLALNYSGALDIETGNYTVHLKSGRVETVEKNTKVNITN